LPCSTSRMIAVAAKVFEIDAIGNTVCVVTGSGSSTFVMPSPRTLTTPFDTMPSATPGTPNSFIFASVNAAIASNRASVGDCADNTGALAPKIAIIAARGDAVIR